MYLYYLLSFKMTEFKKLHSKDHEEDLKKLMIDISANTFILALDGDVDFKPEAVTLLLDRMKKDPLVGAACGRIHPIGSGRYIYKTLIKDVL